MTDREKTLELMLDFGDDGKNLLPVVTQDYTTKEVLILAFANMEALQTTLQTGYATYWSRRRDELWTKGKTSGDLLKVDEIRVNCEQNSLLYLVTKEKGPDGGACHVKDPDGNPYPTCYYRRLTQDNRLEYI